MKTFPRWHREDSGLYLAGAVLTALCVLAWAKVLGQQGRMPMGMEGMEGQAAGGALGFTLDWGVMMTAMMLPSAAPMFFLYARVAGSLHAGERALPPLLFAAVYIVLWLLTGLPVYAASTLVAGLAASSPRFSALIPLLLGLLVTAAGLYQFSPLKNRCLSFCESPLSLLMRKWSSGYAATLRIAAEHAGYCIGCCWGLMVILVAVGSMSIAWVLLITTLVFAEKVFPFGFVTAKVTGAAMLALGVILAIRGVS